LTPKPNSLKRACHLIAHNDGNGCHVLNSSELDRPAPVRRLIELDRTMIADDCGPPKESPREACIEVLPRQVRVDQIHVLRPDELGHSHQHLGIVPAWRNRQVTGNVPLSESSWQPLSVRAQHDGPEALSIEPARKIEDHSLRTAWSTALDGVQDSE